MVTIIALGHPDFSGDNANAMGAQAALAERYEQQGIAVETNPPQAELDALMEGHPLPGGQYIVIGAGAHWLETLAELKKPNVMTVWSGHEPPEGLLEKAQAIDVVHLPEYTLTAHLKTALRDRLVTSPHGVSHNLSRKTIDAAYEAMQSSAEPVPQSDGNKYMLVMLGGDVSEDRKFSADEARQLGIRMGKTAHRNGYMLLGTNGPRTGGKGSHEPGMELDDVSNAFLQGLEESGLPPGQSAFYPFVRGEQSAYKGLLGAVANHSGSIALLPGDSASMLTEAIDTLPAGFAAAYPTESMDESNQQQLTALANGGYAFVEGLSAHMPDKKPDPAAQAIADKFCEKAQGRHFPAPTATSVRGMSR